MGPSASPAPPSSSRLPPWEVCILSGRQRLFPALPSSCIQEHQAQQAVGHRLPSQGAAGQVRPGKPARLAPCRPEKLGEPGGADGRRSGEERRQTNGQAGGQTDRQTGRRHSEEGLQLLVFTLPPPVAPHLGVPWTPLNPNINVALSVQSTQLGFLPLRPQVQPAQATQPPALPCAPGSSQGSGLDPNVPHRPELKVGALLRTPASQACPPSHSLPRGLSVGALTALMPTCPDL